MKALLRTIGIVGVLLFGSSFIFTYTTPGFVEDIAKDFIKDKVQEETHEKIDKISLNKSYNPLLKLASKLVNDNEQEISQLKDKLKNDTHLKLASTIAEMRNLNCECRKKYENRFKANIDSKIWSLENFSILLLDFIKFKYMEVASKLKTDVRIFTGSNTLVFAVLLLVSFFKPGAIAHLFLPGVLLVISTIICSYFYIFEQNWFFTIIYSSYLGWSYLVYLGIVFSLLCDIVFNKARITTKLLNGFLQLVGSALSLVSC